MRYPVAPYANYILPAPLYFEDFESADEGGLPAGWTATSPILPFGYEDLDDPNSDTYLNFVVITRDRVQALGSAGRWDAARRLNFPEAYINGQRITGLINNKFAYHESDVRSGSQYSVLISPRYDLTGKSNVFVVYNSIYEQNQDNIASVEYSIDDGVTWLPMLYKLDGPDILKDAQGNVDPVLTLTTEYGDVARYVDPETGEDRGGYYGAFIGVSTNLWPTLAPYIQERINDDPFESKRIERYRLPEADGKSQVRLRFAQAGTASWYFGVDDVGLYEINEVQPPAITRNPDSQTRIVGSSVTFEGNATGDQLGFQWFKDGTNAIPGATNRVYTLANLRLADAGQFSFTVSNPGGGSGTAWYLMSTLPPQRPRGVPALRRHLRRRLRQQPQCHAGRQPHD
ncbi:MAG TPA: immunoglobulin domain-containing protein [Verrucomicrobiota bacterium]|nr:immunoglobulin domain-containing protein [Verrucomicrobiota bacterium]